MGSFPEPQLGKTTLLDKARGNSAEILNIKRVSSKRGKICQSGKIIYRLTISEENDETIISSF